MTKSPRRRRWLAAVAILFLSGVVGLWLFLRSPAFARWVADFAELAAGELLGERVVIGELELRPLQRSAKIEGLLVSRAEEPGRGETIVAAEAVHLQLGWRDGRPALVRLLIRRPVVRLHLDETGLREFRALQEADGGSQEFPWEELWIEHADLRVQGPTWQVAAEDLSLGPTLDPLVARLDLGPVDVEVGDLQRRVASPGVLRVGLSPTGLSLPPVVLESDDFRVEGQGSVSVAKGAEGAVSVRVDPALARELSRGEVRPLSPVFADAELTGTADGTEVSGLLYWPDFALEVGAREPYRTLSLGTLQGPLSWDGRSLVFDGLQLDWARGRVRIDGRLDPVSTGIYLAVTAEGLSLIEALQATEVSPTPWVSLESDLELHVAGTLKPLRLEGSHDVVVRDLVVRDGPAGRADSETVLQMSRVAARGTVQVTKESVRVGVAPLKTPRSTAWGRAVLGLSPDAPLDVVLDWSRLDVSELAPLGDMELGGRGVAQVRVHGPPSALAVEGSADLEDFVIFGLPFADRLKGPFLSPDLRRLEFPNTHADLGASRYAGSVVVEFLPEGTEVDLAVILSEGRLADFTGIFIDLPEVDAVAEGELSLHGPPDRLTGEVGLRFEEPEIYGETFEAGRAIAWMDDGRFTLEELSVKRLAGEESLLVRGTIGAGWRTELDVVGSGFRLDRSHILAESGVALRGGLALDAQVGGTLFEPEPAGRLTLRNAAVGPSAVDDSTISFDTSEGLLSWSGTIAGPGLQAQGSFEIDGDQAYEATARLDDFPLEGLYPVGADGSPVVARLSGDVALDGAFGETPREVAVDLADGRLRLAWAGHELETPEPFDFHFEDGGRVFGVRGFKLEGGRTELAFGGQRTAEGQVLFAGGGDVDLDLLRAVTSSVKDAQGTAQVNVSVGGPVGSVEPVVDVSIEGARLGTDWTPERFEEVVARLTLRPASVEIREARGRLGGGTWTLAGGLDSEDWVPTRSELAFTLRDGRVQVLDFLPRSTGTAELRLDGPMDDLLLSGQVDIDDMTFAQRIDWEEWILAVSGDHLQGAVSAEREDYFSMDIAVRADETIRVRNNVGDMVASAQLELVGDTRRPGLTGQVRVNPGGSAFLKEREFEVVRGELHFVEPYSYDPELDISLQTRISARDQDYLIATQVMGPYSDWRAATSASPGLPEADINALLLFGMTREELERYGLEGALAVEGADLLASSIASSLGVADGGAGAGGIFGSEVLGEDVLRIDRIDLVSGIDSRSSNAISSELRVLVEGQLPWWEGSTVAVEQNLFRGSDRTLTLERRLQQNLFASGFWAQEQEGRYLPIGGAYGLDLGVRWELE